MKRDMLVKGYEDSASDSEDESVSKITTQKPAAQTSRKKAIVSAKSSYLIKPVERSLSAKRKCNSSSSIGEYETVDSGSDEEVDVNNLTLVSNSKKSKIHSIGGYSNKGNKNVKKNNNILDEYSFNTVFVVDYDMTLVDRNAQPFPGAKKFIRDLYNFNNRRSTMVLYSHASASHIERGLSTYFAQEADMFTEVITDHTMVKNKPVTQVRRVLSNIADLSGPFVIIDDARFNLDEDQYDITIDVSRHFIHDKTNNRVVDIDYKTVWCLLNEGIKNWLLTKKKKLTRKQ